MTNFLRVFVCRRDSHRRLAPRQLLPIPYSSKNPPEKPPRRAVGQLSIELAALEERGLPIGSDLV